MDPTSVIICNKNTRLFICKNNHQNCLECILFKGVARTNNEQLLPSLKPVCRVCGEISKLNQVDVTLEREKLNDLVEKLYERKLSPA